eukprot:gene4396-4649_t
MGIDPNIILRFEVPLLQGLGFDLVVHSPYRALEGLFLEFEDLRKQQAPLLDPPLLAASPQQLATAHSKARASMDVLVMSDAPLLHPPGLLAVAAMRSGFRAVNLPCQRYLQHIAQKAAAATEGAAPQADAAEQRMMTALAAVDELVKQQGLIDEAALQQRATEVDRAIKLWKKGLQQSSKQTSGGAASAGTAFQSGFPSTRQGSAAAPSRLCKPASRPFVRREALVVDRPVSSNGNGAAPQHRALKVIIAGAGIGGLVLAVALLKKGVDVTVYERDLTAIRGEGKYRGPIQVQSNALAALEAIDVGICNEVLRQGCITGDRINGLCDGETGDWYIKFDTFHPAVDRGLPVTRVISRVTLQEILADAVERLGGSSVIENSANVVGFEEYKDAAAGSSGVRVMLEDGRTATADLLIGADGIWSKGLWCRAAAAAGSDRPGCQHYLLDVKCEWFATPPG